MASPTASPEAAVVQQPMISVFEVPTSPHLFDTTTGLIHCIARREGGNRNKRIVFYLETADGSAGAVKPLFVAQKQKEGKFYIYNVSENDYNYQINRNFKKEDFNYVGKIRRKVFRRNQIASNTLFYGKKEQKEQVASLVYDTVSLRYPVMEGFPDRVVYSIIQSGRESAPENRNSSPFPAMNYRAPRIDDAIGFHAHNIDEIGEFYNGLQVLKSRRRSSGSTVMMTPESQRNGGASATVTREPFLVRFKGRGGRPSQKNLQMMDPSTGNVVFQMARWNEDEFTVDFKGPYTPYQAFGIALAQLES